MAKSPWFNEFQGKNMSSMLVKAIVIAFCIFIPMIGINAILANSSKPEILDWALLTIAVPLIIIIISITGIKTNSKKK